MAVALKVSNPVPRNTVAPQPGNKPHGALQFHEPSGESFALQAFREGALKLLHDGRKWRARNGYAGLLEAVVNAAKPLLNDGTFRQRALIATQLMNVFRLAARVEIGELELATAELQGETCTMISFDEGEEDPGRRAVKGSRPRRDRKRLVKPSATKRRLQSLIFKKLNALKLECEVAIANEQ